MKSADIRHPRVLTFAAILADQLRLPPWQAELVGIGVLEKLFNWALDFADDGDLGRYSPMQIAIGIGWQSDASALLGSLIESGCILRHEEQLLLAGFSECAPTYIHKRLARRGHAFADGHAPQRKASPRSKPQLKSGPESGPADKPPLKSGPIRTEQKRTEQNRTEETSARQRAQSPAAAEAPAADTAAIVTLDYDDDDGKRPDPAEVKRYRRISERSNHATALDWVRGAWEEAGGYELQTADEKIISRHIGPIIRDYGADDEQAETAQELEDLVAQFAGPEKQLASVLGRVAVEFKARRAAGRFDRLQLPSQEDA